ncbi:hypothetical protein MUP46_01055 [Patescibacteria group bacterium]|nr:hypothetical protein [Patescibacteria group bacterium]
MNTPKWLFFVLVFWIGATMWCNALEPAQPALMPASMSAALGDPAVEGTGGLSDPGLASASGVTMVWNVVKDIWKALSFDYGIFTGWLVILRAICIVFSIASLYFLIDIIWKVRTMLLGQ